MYFLASRRAPVLVRHAVAFGVAYGVIVYVVINYIVKTRARRIEKFVAMLDEGEKIH